jgi:hypothetical protein
MPDGNQLFGISDERCRDDAGPGEPGVVWLNPAEIEILIEFHLECVATAMAHPRDLSLAVDHALRVADLQVAIGDQA